MLMIFIFLALGLSVRGLIESICPEHYNHLPAFDWALLIVVIVLAVVFPNAGKGWL